MKIFAQFPSPQPSSKFRRAGTLVRWRISGNLPAKPALLGLLGWLGLAAAAQAGTVANRAAQPALAPLAGLPLCFEANRRQASDQVSFLARGASYEFLIGPTEAQILLSKAENPGPTSLLEQNHQPAPRQTSTRSVRMQLVGAHAQAGIRGEGQMPGKVNYLTGNAPSQWRAGVPTYARVRVTEVYPGIDLVYYGNQQRLEYDFSIVPGANPADIALHFEGADEVAINGQGELVLTLGAEEIRQPRPVLYQLVDGVRTPVNGGYLLKDARTVGFNVGPHDAALPLVIDPFLSYSAYFGGNHAVNALAIALDSQTNVYIAGETPATQFPFQVPPGSFQDQYQGGRYNGDAFVAKFDSTLTNLIYFTYLGGSDDDGAYALTVDGGGHAYLAGFTLSTNFPTKNAIFDRISGTINTNTHKFPVDAFVAELTADGSGLMYSTYLGGENVDVASKIAVDSAGDAFVTGYTISTNFPVTTNTAFQSTQFATNSTSAFVTEIAPGGAGLLYSSFLGGTNLTEGEGIAVYGTNLVFVSGYTSSTNFPTTTNAFGKELNGSIILPHATDGFVAKFDTTLSGSNSLLFCSLLGGINSDVATRIAVDASGNAFVTGYSTSADFPNLRSDIPGLHFGLTGSSPLNADAFLTKLSFDATGLTNVQSVLFGGIRAEIGWDIAVETNSGNAYVIGLSTSTNFPTTNTLGLLSATNTGKTDVFVTVFSNDLSGLVYSTYLGGRRDDFGYGIAVDPAGNAYITGRTLSTNFPEVNPFESPLQRTNNAFLAKILLVNPLVDVTVQTAPANLQIVVDGTTTLAPVTLAGVPAGSVHTLSTQPVQDSNGVRYVWTNWSDGGTLTHQIASGSNTTVIARFASQLPDQLALVINGAGKVSPNLNGRTLEAGRNYTVTAQPNTGFLFAGWTGSITSSAATLTFAGQDGMVLEAVFIPNPFIPIKGNYAGLFSPTNGLSFQTSGLLTATLSSQGNFSARIQLAGGTASFSGSFSTNGLFSNTIPAKVLPELAVSLRLDLNGGNVITGEISDGHFTAELEANRAIFTRYNPAPESAHRYTLAIPGSADSLAFPGGDGYGTVTVNNAGRLQFVATLGDRTKFSQSTYVSPDDRWPLYASLYSHGGSIIGWLTFASQPTTDLSGQVVWSKPPQPRSNLYSDGFTVQTNVVGSIYTFINGVPDLNLNQAAFDNGIPVPDFGPGYGRIILENGGLAQSLTNQIILGANNHFTNEGPNKLSLSLSASSGLFQGSMVNPTTGKSISFNGAILQTTNIGAGLFLSTNQTGRVRIEGQ